VGFVSDAVPSLQSWKSRQLLKSGCQKNSSKCGKSSLSLKSTYHSLFVFELFCIQELFGNLRVRFYLFFFVVADTIIVLNYDSTVVRTAFRSAHTCVIFQLMQRVFAKLLSFWYYHECKIFVRVSKWQMVTWFLDVADKMCHAVIQVFWGLVASL